MTQQLFSLEIKIAEMEVELDTVSKTQSTASLTLAKNPHDTSSMALAREATARANAIRDDLTLLRASRDVLLAEREGEEAQARRAVAAKHLADFKQGVANRDRIAQELDQALRGFKAVVQKWVGVNESTQSSLANFYKEALKGDTNECLRMSGDARGLADVVANPLASEMDTATAGVNMNRNAIFNYNRAKAHTPELCEVASKSNGRMLIERAEHVARSVGIKP